MNLLRREVPAASLVVAVDPGKAFNRVWLTSGERGLIGEPVTLPVLREGIDELERLIAASGVGGAPVIGLEATGSLHRAWAAEIERRWPGSLRLFAPSETTAARTQLGSRRFKTDDRDCAALVWLLRQGAGRPAEPDVVAAMLGGVRHRAQLVDARRVLQQRLHDQLNALCPGLSAPPGHGRALKIASPTGQAVLACAAAFDGRPPTPRSLLARAPGRMSQATAAFWAARWKRLLDPPADASLRAGRLAGDLARWRGLQADIDLAEQQFAGLLAQTAGQILTTLPGVAVVRAAEFSAYTLPIGRWPTPEHLYSATGLATATYQSSTITRRGRISRQGLPEHRNALMGIAWGLSLNSDAFKARNAEYRARGFRPIQARVALARHACRLTWRLLQTQYFPRATLRRLR
ncbi:transposase [Baekduia soli]|uniref:Transposase n=1 Tax=Baekduia soli TaxID=496014 RepID=A0A5B8UAC8_9ACTN|nr:transposase [Baekduia soli]QEC49561.1 transposase [Baekduia soli]